jgi:ParB family chromosome partitioning protein
MAGMESVACVIHEGPIDVLAVQLVENALREDLKPVEQAKAFRALIESNGWEAKQLAAELAIDPATVSRCLALLNLPESVQEQVEQGTLAATTAYEVSRLRDPAEQLVVAQVAVEQGLTRADVMEVVKARKAKRPAQSKPEPVAIDLGDFTVTIRWKRAAGTTAAEVLQMALDQVQAA